MKKIEHSIALLTGTNRGIGKAIVEDLLARGASNESKTFDHESGQAAPSGL